MNVNGIGKQPCYEKTNGVGKNHKNAGSSFSKSLSENLNDRAENGQVREENAMPVSPFISTAYSYRNVAAGNVPGNSRAGAPDGGAAAVAKGGESGLQAVKACTAKRIAYWESDHVKSYAAQGFALLAQVDVESRSVYVEQKLENGTVKGYEVSVDELEQDTVDPIGQMALEAWEKKEAGEEKELTELTVEEALAEFYDFIQDRIKNGPPKYQIGNSEFSVAEWDKLLEDFDDQLDALREEMRERIAKLQEQQMQKELAMEQQGKQTGNPKGQQMTAELSRELQDLRDEVQDAEAEDTEEKLLTALFQEKGI